VVTPFFRASGCAPSLGAVDVAKRLRGLRAHFKTSGIARIRAQKDYSVTQDLHVLLGTEE
jgi:hypothetical protein